jgi:flagellar hook-length control protein FliK
MQTTTSPIQANGAAPAPQRPTPMPGIDAGQFSAALNREIEQRQDMAPAPAPQPKPATPAKQADAAHPASADKAPAPQAQKTEAPKSEAKKAGKSADADEADKGKDKADAAEHPATAQVTDMLALVASLKPLQGATAAKGTGEQPLATARVGKGAGDAGQLAALQAAVKALGKDEHGDGKQLAVQDTSKSAAADALGAAAVADPKDSGKEAVDLRAFQDAPQLKAHPDAAPTREALAEVAAMKEPAPAAQLLAQAQPVTLEVAQAVASAAGDRIAARVGTPAWDNQVGQKIVWMVAGEEQSASLTLNPPDLGPMQVVLSVTNDQASVTFSSNQLEVRQALENALPRLREMMGENGIALGNASVNAGMPDQQQAQGEQARSSGMRSAPGAPRTSGGEAVVRPAPRAATVGGRGAVDTFA